MCKILFLKYNFLFGYILVKDLNVHKRFFNNTDWEKLFYSTQYKNACLTASYLFQMITHQLSSIHSIITY